MKLLLDENLSDRITSRIIDLYPNSIHVKNVGLINSNDVLIWEYAKVNDFVIAFDKIALTFANPLSVFPKLPEKI